MKRKFLALLAVAVLGVTAFTGCGNSEAQAAEGGFNTSRGITVVSREDGSGTRTAFIEITGVQARDADGNNRDFTTLDAEIANGTSLVIGSVAGNEYAMGYISLGSLNDNVRAINVNGAAPTSANVQSGAYPLFRTFYVSVQNDLDSATQSFIDFMLSQEGQAVVSGNYIPVSANAPAFAGENPGGTIVVAGSTSVAPLMERLREAYIAINPNVNIEINVQGTSAGIQASINGTAQIGMSSRALNATELESVNAIAIAYDGLAVIVNNANPLADITTEEIRQIFVGELTRWNEIN